ncbi:MAG TPA: TlpA disulfide reductase family protein [Geothrix sp.]|jgi:thiol-disulfide isomerase/thioredoxin|nr:TlpA disulfide reductase family protein [Geothrix sp.]
MNRLLRALLGALVLVLSTPVLADTAPDFSLPGQDGKPVRLSELRGKVVYVDFWASWCGPCRQSFPWMNQLQAAWADKGLVIVAINLDQERPLADRFIEAMKPRFPVAFDPQGTTAEQYKVQGMPSSYIIDRQGNIHARHMGFREHETAQVTEAIRQLLEAK